MVSGGQSPGDRREQILLTDEDRHVSVGRLAELPERFRVEVQAFVLMDNQDHLRVRPVLANLSRAIQCLQRSYSVRFNWATCSGGHDFQGGVRVVGDVSANPGFEMPGGGAGGEEDRGAEGKGPGVRRGAD